MGILRFLLAFAVFNAHARLPMGFSIVAGFTAVHCFFVISGFYMAMVLSEKYFLSGATYYDFVSSRMLRLAPSYLLVVILTIAVAMLAYVGGLPTLPPFQAMQQLTESGAGVLFHVLNALSQICLLGEDAYSFLNWTRTAGLGFMPAFQDGTANLNDLLIVPPAWSLSVEIYFYLLAPWLVRLRTRAIVTLLAASLLCRGILAWQLGWQGDPWSYRFFPSELAFFLTGVLAYRSLVQASRGTVPWMPILLALGGILGLAEIFAMWHPDMPMQRWARVPLFALLVAGTPILFSMTKDWHLDRRIGELSYPLYVSHFLVIWVVAYFFADQSAYLARATVIAGVILAALALRLWVDVPVDRFRQARLEKRAAGVPGKPEGCIEDEAGLRGAALPASAGK